MSKSQGVRCSCVHCVCVMYNITCQCWKCHWACTNHYQQLLLTLAALAMCRY